MEKDGTFNRVDGSEFNERTIYRFVGGGAEGLVVKGKPVRE